MRLILGLLALAAIPLHAVAQQVTNPNADLTVTSPAYPSDRGPRVLIDQGHANLHTLETGYAPFATLLRNDGYRVNAHRGRINAETLAEADVLVIANAAPPPVGSSAFLPLEIAALRSWVEAGGALLLIADHRPYAGAAAELGAAFGITFRNAYAVHPGNRGQDLFRSGAGLADHPIVAGAEGDTAVTAVRSFTGSAFTAPGARPLLTLGEGYLAVEAETEDEIEAAIAAAPSAAGLLQGATLELGRGRIVVLGEAAMLTSQLTGPQQRLTGIGAPGAEQNKQFALNLMHWLSRRRGY